MSAAKRMGLRPKLFYGLGSVAYGVKDQGFQSLLLLYYNQVLGLPASMVSAALLFALLIDAFIDPVIGHASDNWRSKLGRRHPFMYAAAIPIAITFFLIWNPPNLAPEAMFFYLFATAVALRASLSLYEIPNASLLPELTEDYDERTALLSYRYFFGVAGGIAMTVAVFTIFLAPTPDYPTGQLNPDGYQAYSIAAIVVMLISIFVSAIGTQRTASQFHAPPQRSLTIGQLARDMVETIANRSILVMLAVGLFSGMAVGLGAALGIYLQTYYWELIGAQLAILSVGSLVGTVLAAILSTPLARLLGKKHAALTLFIIAVIVSISPVLLREIGLFPPNGDPLLMPLLLLERVVSGLCGIGAAIIGGSMIADIVEEVQEKTGRRAEGLLLSANTFVQKAVSGFGLLGAGVILDLVAFPEGARPGDLDAPMLSNLAFAYAAALIILFSSSIACLFGYPLSRESHEDRLRKLAARDATPAE